MLREFIHNGIRGFNEAIPTALHDPNEAFIGILPKHYYLIGADSGVGKTTFTDYYFLLHPYFNSNRENIDWFYYSLELGKEMKLASWLNYLIHKKENKIIPLTELAGFKKEKLTEENAEIVFRHLPEIEKLAEKIRLQTDGVTPDDIKRDLLEYASENGEIIYEKNKVKDYIPKNPKKKTIIIVDHIALLTGDDTKKSMDKLSAIAVDFRNKFGFTFVFCQQFNSTQETQSRTQNKNTMRISPGKSDFGDSTYTYRDADVVFGGVCPANYEIPQFRNFDIAQYKKALTFWFLIKNRWIGVTDVYSLQRQKDVPIFNYVYP